MRIFSIILFSLIMLANLSMWLVLGTGWNLFQFVFCLIIVASEIVLFKKKVMVKKPGKYMVLTLVAALIVAWVSTWVFGFGKMGVYDLKIKYADAVGYTTNHFPSSAPEGATLEDMGMMPSIMQGDGYVSALFSADEETIKSLENKAADSAIMSFTAEQYLNGNIPAECQEKAQKIFENRYDFEDVSAVITVDHSTLIYEQKHQSNTTNDIVIYIIESNFYWNHPRTNAVIVDKTTGYIEYVGQ